MPKKGFFGVCFLDKFVFRKNHKDKQNRGEGQLSIIDGGGRGVRTEILLFNFGLNIGKIGITKKGKITTK